MQVQTYSLLRKGHLTLMRAKHDVSRTNYMFGRASANIITGLWIPVLPKHHVLPNLTSKSRTIALIMFGQRGRVLIMFREDAFWMMRGPTSPHTML